MDNATEIIKMWNLNGQYVSFGLYVVAFLILLGYVLTLALIKEPKDKYDFINKSEINVLWYVGIILICAIAIFIHTVVIKVPVEITILWLFVRIFVTIMMGIILGVIVRSLLKFYYPFYIEKRLKRLRYRPRISPHSNKPMKLLNEEEEDVYLDEGMQAEENLFSIDYDVWIDEDNGYTKIEKYFGHLHAQQCPECNYQTFKIVKEELVPPKDSSGENELMKYFDCGYCGHKSRKVFKVSTKLDG